MGGAVVYMTSEATLAARTFLQLWFRALRVFRLQPGAVAATLMPHAVDVLPTGERTFAGGDDSHETHIDTEGTRCLYGFGFRNIVRGQEVKVSSVVREFRFVLPELKHPALLIRSDKWDL